MPEWKRARYPKGNHDLGLAHGAPAVALVLAGAADIVGEPARRLCAEVTRFVLAPRFEPDAAVRLPATDEDDFPARAAWCYGDPAVAAALLVAARALDDDELEGQALQLARRAAVYSCELVRDGGLCHGAAGLALIFHQLYDATGESLFADAAHRWYRRLLQFRRNDLLGGFGAWWPDRNGTSRFQDDTRLISGLLGIGLTLISAVSPIAPRWASVLGIAPFWR
jgi:hypothetical protein